jgi:hypothetical protein
MQLNVDDCFDDLDIGESKKVKKICRAFGANSPRRSKRVEGIN